MNEAAEEILAQALRLAPSDRAAVAERLLASLRAEGAGRQVERGPRPVESEPPAHGTPADPVARWAATKTRILRWLDEE